MTKPAEPLRDSAPLALRLASELCRGDSATGEDCSWGHGIWQYLRILGLVVSIESRSEFYRGAFGSVTGADGPPRMLLSGTADYGLLACLVAAFRARGIEPQVTLVDLCETPLAVNRWYAERFSCRLETTRCDILEYAAPQAFDAICTDSFLGRFAPPRRLRVVAKWRELLRPGGLAITANRLRPPGIPERAVFSAEQARALHDRVLHAAEASTEPLGMDPRELARWADGYARTHVSWSVRSEQEVGDLFERCDFHIEHLSALQSAGNDTQQGSGPPTGKGYRSVRIVASRR